jgi:hypothetical protein
VPHELIFDPFNKDPPNIDRISAFATSFGDASLFGIALAELSSRVVASFNFGSMAGAASGEPNNTLMRLLKAGAAGAAEVANASAIPI